MLRLLLLLSPLIDALPFVTAWNVSQANATTIIPAIYTLTSVTVDWGDSSPTDTTVRGTLVNFNHTYSLPGVYKVSIEGQIFWTSPHPRNDLVDIVSWGNGFHVNKSSIGLFQNCYNLRVSAPSNTQPMILPGATLSAMFFNTSFDSSLDWDLANVTNLATMFAHTPLNKPVTFRNTQGVTSISGMFTRAIKFNQPFHIDASSLLDASNLFSYASNFNQVVNLTNSSQLMDISGMFYNATSFNQPFFLNVTSVNTTHSMFAEASKFNQPINFQESSKLVDASYMFFEARSFNQPVVMDTSSVILMAAMFYSAYSLTSTINFTNLASVKDMTNMFEFVNWFTQDLSSWNTSNVTACDVFCSWCGLPRCHPCSSQYTDSRNLTVCSSGTKYPSRAPTTPAPTTNSPTTRPAPTFASSSASAAARAHPSSGNLFVVTLFVAGTMLTMAQK